MNDQFAANHKQKTSATHSSSVQQDPVPLNSPVVESVEPSRLLPRVTFRTLFAITTLGALLAALARVAGVAGSVSTRAMALGLLIAVGFLAACFLAFALFYLIAWLVSIIWYRAADESVQGSPFAEDQLPPQILPPRNYQP